MSSVQLNFEMRIFSKENKHSKKYFYCLVRWRYYINLKYPGNNRLCVVLYLPF